MTAGFVLGLALAIPVIMPPLIFVWFINSGGIVSTFRRARKVQSLQTR